jgi:hypothetical protein
VCGSDLEDGERFSIFLCFAQVELDAAAFDRKS